MPLASGLGSQFGFAKESTYGTVVTPNRFFEFDSEGFALDQTYQDAIGLRAGRTFMPSGRMRRTTRQAGGGVPFDIPTKGLGAVLDLMHGLTPTVVQQAATTAYLQTHLVGTSQPNKSITAQVNKPTSQAADTPFTYPGTVLTGFGLSLDVGGVAKGQATFDAKDELTPTTTPAGPALATATYPAGVTSFLGTGVGVSITMAGASVAVARSISINWTQPYKTDRFFIGSDPTKARPIPNGIAQTTGQLELEFFDGTAYGQFRAGDPLAIVLTLQNNLIASPYYEKLVVTISAAQVRGSSPQVSGPDVLDITVPFTAGDNGVDTPVKYEYTSTDTAV